jgi:hypothetical protein
VFRQLESHRHVADLRLESAQLPFLGIEAAPFEPLLPALKEHAPPLLDFVHRHLDLARDLVDRLPADDAQHHLRLALRTPPFRQFLDSAFRRHRHL